MVLTKKQIHILIYLNGILNGPVVIYITEPRNNASWAIFWRIPTGWMTILHIMPSFDHGSAEKKWAKVPKLGRSWPSPESEPVGHGDVSMGHHWPCSTARYKFLEVHLRGAVPHDRPCWATKCHCCWCWASSLWFCWVLCFDTLATWWEDGTLPLGG